LLLDKIELNYPDQKLEGLYRYLRAESDRVAGKYDAALRNYEVLLQLRQWAGYRDRTLHGMAECQLRLGQLLEAQQRFAQVEQLFPKYFEKEKLAERRKLVEARLSRMIPPSEPGGKPQLAKFADVSTGFEPAEKQWFGKMNFKVVPGLGIAGPHLGLFESHPVYQGYLTWEHPLPNLTNSGHYWAEIWYRENLMSMFPGFNQHIYWNMYGELDDNDAVKGRGTYPLERTYGAWRKVGFLLDAPPKALDGRMAMGGLVLGAFEVDAVEVRAVSDEELHWLSNFIEGTSPGEEP
jgi:tetratricopeptide (TPR) repeat protein